MSNTLTSMQTGGPSRIIISLSVIKMITTVACNKLSGAYGSIVKEDEFAGTAGFLFKDTDPQARIRSSITKLFFATFCCTP